MRIFRVSALPRSGTAWASTMFNLSPGVLCSHEMIADPGIPDVEDELAARLKDFTHVGDCCSTYTDPRRDGLVGNKAWIDRPESECRIATELSLRTSICDPVWQGLLDQRDIWIEENDPFIIHFDDLFTLEGARKLWQYCVGPGFPEEKVKTLLGLRVQKTSLKNYDSGSIEAKLNSKWEPQPPQQ